MNTNTTKNEQLDSEWFAMTFIVQTCFSPVIPKEKMEILSHRNDKPQNLFSESPSSLISAHSKEIQTLKRRKTYTLSKTQHVNFSKIRALKGIAEITFSGVSVARMREAKKKNLIFNWSSWPNRTKGDTCLIRV